MTLNKRTVVLLATLLSMEGASAVSKPTSLVSPLTAPLYDNFSIIRGGATPSSSKNKKTKKKKKKKSGKAKKVIDDAMKEKDAAEALGDAIRDRADVLRSDDPLLQSIDWSISSLGHAVGASDRRRDGGGVEPSQSSVLANYFLKSHGGAHALQCVCSFLATLSAVGMILFKNSALGFTLLQRTLQFAMIKHVSGLMASAAMAAKAVPKIGLSQARQWMEQIVLDPVSQYTFYTALLLLWLPSKQRLESCWWWSKAWIPPVIVGPILIREYISNLMVISDVLVLLSVGDNAGITTVLNISQSIVNALMSVLVSPQIWRSADPTQRQVILSKLVGRVSLVLEVAVGALLSVDMVYGLFAAAFFSGPKRPPFKESLIRLVCVRLYVHFLWVRRTKISKLSVKLRGGASKFPFKVLDVIYEPVKSMGLERESPKDPEEMTWKDYAAVGLGFAQ